MIEVIAVTPERVTVSSKGLHRVYVPITGEVIDDLVSKTRALKLVAEHNEAWPNETARYDSYEALCKSS